MNSISVLEKRQYYQRWDHPKNVLELTETLKDSLCRSFFDNFYTSLQLVNRLIKIEKLIFVQQSENTEGFLKNIKLTKRSEIGAN